jgi:GNAT superfamily N-acetyltransferase
MSAFVAPDAPPERVHVVDLEHEPAGERAAFLEMPAEYMTSAGDAALPAARYDWLYLRNPAGRSRTFLARDVASGAILGMTSLFPRRVLVGGEVETGAVGGGAYVRPSARGRGIATPLHRVAVEPRARRPKVPRAPKRRTIWKNCSSSMRSTSTRRPAHRIQPMNSVTRFRSRHPGAHPRIQ